MLGGDAVVYSPAVFHHVAKHVGRLMLVRIQIAKGKSNTLKKCMWENSL